MAEEEDLEDYLERALSVNRRSVFFIDSNLQEFSEELFKNISNLDEISDENIVETVAKTLSDKDGATKKIEALSLEVTPKPDQETSDYAVTFKQTIKITDTGELINITEPDPELIVNDVIDEILDCVITASEKKGDMELYFYHPLANREDIEKMTETFSQTQTTLTDQAVRLKTAMKIILVMAAKQIVVSYRRILTEESERRKDGADPEEVTRATCERCLAVTEHVADMAVMYLKNATENVIDTSVNDVKVIMGRMRDEVQGEIECDRNDNEIEEITKL